MNELQDRVRKLACCGPEGCLARTQCQANRYNDVSGAIIAAVFDHLDDPSDEVCLRAAAESCWRTGCSSCSGADDCYQVPFHSSKARQDAIDDARAALRTGIAVARKEALP